MSIHLRTHPKYVEGCKPCKWATVGMATVPGGARDQRTGIGQRNQRERDLHRYRAKRQAGEQPDGTTKVAMDRSERKQDLWDRRQQDVVDWNTPEAAKKVQRSLTNQS